MIFLNLGIFVVKEVEILLSAVSNETVQCLTLSKHTINRGLSFLVYNLTMERGSSNDSQILIIKKSSFFLPLTFSAKYL